MNPAALFKLKGYWERFSANHPKLLPYLNACRAKGYSEGTVIDIKVTPAGGQPLEYNMKLSADDMALFQELTKLLEK